jgi:hypothetical protein
MAIPTDRDSFKAYCMRKLGFPQIRIHVTDEQIDDRVDEALYKFARFHYDGSEKVLLAKQLTAGEASTKTLTMEQSIIGVIDVYPIGFSANPSSGNFFNAAAFQVMLSDVLGQGSVNTGGLSNYVIMRMSLNTMEQVLVGRFPFRYGEKTNTLYLDVAPEKLHEGMYVLIEAYRINDPTTFPDVWADPWLQRYTVALIKQNYGEVMSKYSGTQLPGGVTVNGAQIKADAEAAIAELEDELVRTYSPILSDMFG